MPLALFGITNDTLSLVVNLLLLFLVVLWLALVAYTFFDARRRIEDTFLVICATAASLVFPYVGTIVYSILRPPEFLADQRERELEIRAAELRLRQLEEQSCPNCEHPVERNFLRCPNCRARIKDPCESCGKPIDPRWSVCPYCETPVRQAPPPERPEPRRRSSRSRSEQQLGARSRRRAPAKRERSSAPPRKKPSPRSSKPAPRSSSCRRSRRRSSSSGSNSSSSSRQPAHRRAADDAQAALERTPSAAAPARFRGHPLSCRALWQRTQEP